uniref:Dehydrogenase/reductase SDR family member 4-like n=1 Tax=Peromyscus maniculatus bairdii TaxID=230844 RepID=A0A8C8UI53_PERMB
MEPNIRVKALERSGKQGKPPANPIAPTLYLPNASSFLSYPRLYCLAFLPSHWIGFAIARRLAKDGAHVVISSRKQQNVDRAVATLQEEGLSVTGTVCHVGKAEDRERLVAKHSGGVDFLVCNAGVNPLVGSTLGASEQVWDKVRCHPREKSLDLFLNPEDCAGLVSFLCSADASYITGENIVVAGCSSRL